jgi:hypothetical protein
MTNETHTNGEIRWRGIEGLVQDIKSCIGKNQSRRMYSYFESSLPVHVSFGPRFRYGTDIDDSVDARTAEIKFGQTYEHTYDDVRSRYANIIVGGIKVALDLNKSEVTTTTGGVVISNVSDLMTCSYPGSNMGRLIISQSNSN